MLLLMFLVVSTDAATIRGAVTRADGSGLSGVRVEVTPLLANFEAQRALLERREPPAVAAGKTDASGRFALSLPRPGIWQVTARARGHLPMRYLLLPQANSVELPPVTLRRAGEAWVEVVDSARRPVPGAGVFAQSVEGKRWLDPEVGFWRPVPRLGWTGEDGRLRLARALDERLKVRVRLPGRLEVWQARGGHRIRVAVAPGAGPRRRLEVHTASEAPLPGAVVAFSGRVWPIGVTGEDGTLDLVGKPEGPVRLVILTADGRSRLLELTPDAGDTSWTLPERALLEGRVTDGSGAPLAGALVWPGRDPGLATSTDGSGRFSLPSAGTGKVRLQAHAAGFLPRSETLEPAEGSALPGVELALARGAALSGRVVDENGAAVPGARILARVSEPDRRLPAIRLDPADGRAVSDSEGRFVLENLPPAIPVVLTADRDGHRQAEAAVPALTGGQRRGGVELVAVRGRLAFGRVLGGEERPLAGVRVELRASGAESVGSEERFAGISDETGRFEIRDLPADKIDIHASGAGYAPMRVRGIEVPAAGPVDLGTLLLLPGASLAGRVVDGGGAGVEGAQVRLVEDPRRVALDFEDPQGDPAALSGPDGSFLLESLDSDRAFHLRIDAAAFLPEVVQGLRPEPAEPLVVSLSLGARLEGEVVDKAGRGIASAEVTLQPLAPDGGQRSQDTALAAAISRSARTGPDGRFILERLLPGRAEVEAWAEDFQPSPPRPVELLAGKDGARIRLIVEEGAMLEGRVLTRDLEPVPGASVRVGRPAATTDSEGRYRVAGIPPGTRRVEVRHSGFNPILRELEIEAGSNGADFVLAGGASVTGRAVDDADLPLSGVAITLESLDRGPEPPTARSGGDGSFVFGRVADGHYRVRAVGDGLVAVPPAVELDVAGSSVDGVEVRLRKGAIVEGRVLGLDFEELALVAVEARGAAGDRVGEVDFEGGYRIDGLAPGHWLLVANLPGGRRQARARIAVEVDTPRVSRDLEFGGGRALSGLVLYAGRPLPASPITIQGHDLPVERESATGADGRFLVEDLPAGRYRIAIAKHDQRLFHNEDVDLREDLDLVLEVETVHLAGQVVDAGDLTPLEGVSVVLRQQVGGAEGSVFGTSSGPDGRFVLDHLAAGSYRLTVQHNGYQGQEQALEVSVGGGPGGVQLFLERAQGLPVAVALASGRRPDFIILRGRDEGGREYAETRQADGAGAALFSTLPPGRWLLRVGSPGAASVELPVTVPGEPLAVTLPTAGRLKVLVPELAESDAFATLEMLDSRGRPFRRLLWGGELEGPWRVVGGWATVEEVPAGTWSVRVVDGAGRVWTGPAATTGGPDVEVVLEAGGG